MPVPVEHAVTMSPLAKYVSVQCWLQKMDETNEERYSKGQCSLRLVLSSVLCNSELGEEW